MTDSDLLFSALNLRIDETANWKKLKAGRGVNMV